MAPVWALILAYLLGFVLLEAALYLYLRRDEARATSVPSRPTDREAGLASVADRHQESSAGGATVACPHCGARNERDPSYTYCRECVRELV